jgi:diacylglycerol kinase family enzyme
MKNNFFALRENDLSQCVSVFMNLLMIFLILIFTASSVSASDENDIWKRYGSSKKLYKGDTYTVNDYKIEAYNFPELQKGSITTPFIGLKVYKNDDYVKTITLGLHKFGICDEIKITATDLPSGQVTEWQDDEYTPWGKIKVEIKRRPKFDISISTDEEEYQQNSIIIVNIIVRNRGDSDAKNVELEYDTGGLEVDSTNIDKSRTRFTRRDPITGELNLKTPETIDKKEIYTISVTVTGEDLEGGELSETKSVSIDVLPDSGSIYVQSTPSGAEISIDGTYKGITPLTISDVSIGYHTIKLTKSGYEDYYTGKIYISTGETTPISASLARVVPTARPTPTVPKTGYASIDSDPRNAIIEVDGDYRGTTPRTIPVSVGYHTIKLTKSGYEDYIKEIYVSAGRTVPMSKKLAPITTTKSTPGTLETIGRNWMLIIVSILIIIAGKKVLIEIRLKKYKKEYKTTKKRSIQKNDMLLMQFSKDIDKNTFEELEKMKIAIDNDDINEAKRHYNEVVNYINTKY